MAMVDPKKYAGEFREFLLKSNMFSLAMGVVIGAAVGKVVAALVDDLIMPIVGVLTPAGDWRAFKLSIWRFNWTLGHFLGAVVDFLIIGIVVFLVTKMFVKQAPLLRRRPAGPARSRCTPMRRAASSARAT